MSVGDGELLVDWMRRTAPAMQATNPAVEAFMMRKREQWLADGTPGGRTPRGVTTRVRAIGFGSAQAAWARYRASMIALGAQRRQLRKREFVAGYESGQGR